MFTVVFPSTQMPPLDGGIKLNSNWVLETQFERKISEKKVKDQILS